MLLAAGAVGAGAAGGRAAELLDAVRFGDPGSETAHGVACDNSEVRAGGLGQRCRVILPTVPPSVSGGSITVTVGCDPERQSYLTARLWGGDVGATVLHLFHDGKQLGCNQSDWPPLDKLNWREKEPRLPGRFFYSTYLLPRHVTRGKRRVALQIVSKGRTYSYAPSYERAQYKQQAASQGIYAVYTHTEPFFTPPADEAQGRPEVLGGVWRAPSALGPGEHVKREARRMLDGLLRRKLSRPADALALAMAYGATWSRQHKDEAILRRVIRTVDTYVLRDDVRSLGWFGPGELAEAAWRVGDDAGRAGLLDEKLPPAGKARKAAYADFFRKALDHQTEPRNRGGLTNQDIYILTSAYRCNLLLKRIAPGRALPEKAALDYVHQAIGLRPYRGRHYPGKGVQQSTAYRYIIGGPIFLSEGRDYFWITPKGSSREHGYVCHYGELAQQTATLYELTGDERIRRQAVRMIAARAPFRVFSNDRDGNVALRIESVIGWRHSWYGGRVEYGDAYLKAAAVLGDSVSLRLAQLYLAHNMIYRKVDRGQPPLLVQRVGCVAKVAAAAPSTFRLPMRDDQPDFAWADEGIGTLAFKHGRRRCWMTMGWRAAGINNIARVHCTEPTFDRIANIRIATQFTPSGRSIARPAQRSGAFVKPGTALLTDGEKLPLAAGPLGGQGDFYTVRYGEYLIGMNCTAGKTFELKVPPDLAGRPLVDLITKRPVGGGSIRVAPGTTVILHARPGTE